MGWVWKDDDEDITSSSASAAGDDMEIGNPKDDVDRYNRTRTVVNKKCSTEEIEPGKFVRKCETTEQIFKHCLGRPDEVVRSIKEYTEEDVTDLMVNGGGGSSSLYSEGGNGSSLFPGLRSDIDAIQRDVFGGLNKFFEAAEEIQKEIFGSIGGGPHIFGNRSPSADKRLESDHIKGRPLDEEVALPNKNANAGVDLSGLARDV